MMDVLALFFQTTEKSLRELFGQKGTVTDCSLKFERNQFRRFAFIGFSSAEQAQDAQRFFDRTFVNSSKISVSYCFLFYRLYIYIYIYIYIIFDFESKWCTYYYFHHVCIMHWASLLHINLHRPCF